MGTVLPTAALEAAAGDAVPAAAALAFFAAARRFAALVAEEGVPEPEARAVAVKWGMHKDTYTRAIREETCGGGLSCSLFALIGSSSNGTEYINVDE